MQGCLLLVDVEDPTMVRTWVCLPLCLLLAPSYPNAVPSQTSQPSQQVFIGNSAPQTGLPDPQKDVIGFLDACLKRYSETVKGYTLNFRKRERIGGEMQPWETIDCYYREEPPSVFFDWKEGARLVAKALYVEGENKNSAGKSQLVALPKLLPLPIKQDLDSSSSKKSGRYALSEFGLKQAMERVLKGCKQAYAEKALHVEYLGLHKVLETGDKTCHKIRRYNFARPETDDGAIEVTIYVDRETLFQVGTIVLGKDGELLGEYYFRDIHLNPEFAANQFTTSMLKK